MWSKGPEAVFFILLLMCLALSAFYCTNSLSCRNCYLPGTDSILWYKQCNYMFISGGSVPDWGILMGGTLCSWLRDFFGLGEGELLQPLMEDALFLYIVASLVVFCSLSQFDLRETPPGK